jgi:hypothetical protein
MTKKPVLQVVDLANDEKDDWLKKAFPKAREEDLAIHDQLAKEDAKRKKAKDK